MRNVDPSSITVDVIDGEDGDEGVSSPSKRLPLVEAIICNDDNHKDDDDKMSYRIVSGAFFRRSGDLDTTEISPDENARV
jgi:hypothetical protein